MKKIFLSGIVLIILLVAAAVWRPASAPAASAQTVVATILAHASSAPLMHASKGSLVLVASDAAHGTYLQASDGMTLYIYNSDAPGVSNCDATCVTTHPAYYIPPSIKALLKDPKVPGTLGRITRNDGTTQLTYNGMPLYVSVKDAYPGNAYGAGSGWSIARP